MTSFTNMPLAPGEADEIAAMLRAGRSTADVVAWIGCAPDQVRRVGRKVGVLSQRPVSPNNAAAARMADDGYTKGEIAAALGMTPNAAHGAIRRGRAARSAG